MTDLDALSLTLQLTLEEGVVLTATIKQMQSMLTSDNMENERQVLSRVLKKIDDAQTKAIATSV